MEYDTLRADPAEFREQWNSQIDSFGRLRDTLPDKEYDRHNDALNELRDLVDVAAEQLEAEE